VESVAGSPYNGSAAKAPDDTALADEGVGVEAKRREVRGLRLSNPFGALVIVLLLAIGVTAVAGLRGISQLDETLSQEVVKETQRLVQVTSIRRLFRMEVVLAHKRHGLPPGPERDDLDQQLSRLREERSEDLERLKAVGVPGAEATLALVAALHAHPVGDPLGVVQPWEKPIADLVAYTEGRIDLLLQKANRQGTAARRVLLFASAAAMLTGMGLGGLVWRRVRQSARQLASREAQLMLVVESAPSLLVVLSKARKPTFLSARTSEFLGHPLSTLEQDFFVWVKPDARPTLAEHVTLCAEQKKPAHGVNVRAAKADGSEWDAWLSLSPVRGEAGADILVQILDITAQRKAEAQSRDLEAQLRQAQKMESIGLLAGGIAHDFNNLLTAIKGYGSLLVEQLRADPSVVESAEQIMAAADRAALLTRKLLSFSRKQNIDLRPLSLAEVVRGMDHLLRRTLGEDVRLEVRTDAVDDVCMLDAGQVEQVLMNLAVNARQAMPKGGLLIIETSRIHLGQDYADDHHGVKPGAYAQLTISDNGTGMTPEVQRRAFEPFFTTKPAGQGTGLGLSVVYGAVRQHGGHINLYSEVNVGTTFRIYWPAIEGAAASARPAPQPVLKPTGHGLLLLVEDDALVRSFAQKALRAHGYEVVVAESAEVAMELASAMASPPEVLITDVILPGRHGPALAHELRQRFPGLPVLFCSGYSEQLMGETGNLPAGASLLQKPYDVQMLIARVQEIAKGAPGPSHS
jgi:signal transduction histidine kinase/ActR/RegA family two-component response regulator